MTFESLSRAIGLAAVTCAAIVGAIHVWSIVSVAPGSALGVCLATIPVLIAAALAYIVAARRTDIDLRPSVWAIACWVGVMIYSGLNFELVGRATEGGNVEVVGGRTVLAAHGRVIRQLSPAEARTLEGWALRGLSGDLMPFFVLTGIGLLALAPRKRSAIDEHAL